MERQKRGLTANTIKWIAIAAMLIDHIAWGFVPFDSAAGQIMHVIGRITAPTMCFFLAEGYVHTHNFSRYAMRLGIFALISQIPFTLLETGKFQFIRTGYLTEVFSVIYTLFLSLLAIRACDKIKNPIFRILAVCVLCVLSIPGDWMFFDILFSLAFWRYHGDFQKQRRAFFTLTVMMFFTFMLLSVSAGYPVYREIFQAGVLLCIPILSFYNGQRGGGRNSKWTFYIFYPAHLLVLGVIKLFI